MGSTTLRLSRAFCLAVAGSLVALSALAQDYPARPIRAITTTSAGGLSDLFMRALGEELRQRLGQPVIVENRPGGSMNLGTRACAEAPPDGYTICILHTESLTYNLFLFRNLPYDPDRQLQPVSNLFFLTQALLANAALGAKTVDQLVAASKAKPGTLSYSTASPALALYMEKLKTEKGADWVRVPFKGGADAVNGMLSGATPISLIGLGNVLGHLQSGLITAVAIGNEARSPLYPDVPTIAETGYRGAPSTDWYGLFAPAGTPQAVVTRLSEEVNRIVRDPDFAQRNIIARGLVPAANTPEAFAAQIKRDRVIAEGVVKEAGLPMN